MHVVICTAGHIDHGKSALVKALTGTDPDRLKEEKERGMTTDLGFAFLGPDVTIIDVPGHERFVRHMLAGASTTDLVMLVVAADDGVMPQTREHFEICRLLGLRRGIIVITKVDLVEPDMVELVKEDVVNEVKGSFLENAPVVAVSAVTGEGVAELRAVIGECVAQLEAREDRGVFRLPVDRCFTMKGFGTVVAGTVLSGGCRVGDGLELLPQCVEVRVRGIQKHNQLADAAVVGERAALNLQGIERQAVVRGNVLATPGYFRPTTTLNASLSLLQSASRPLPNMARVHLHVGTAETMCRVVLLDQRELVPGGTALVQMRLESPVVCDWGDRYVIRLVAPQQTVGGGSILEPNPTKERRFDEKTLTRLRALQAGEAGSVLEQYLMRSRFETKTVAQIARGLGISTDEAQRMCKILLEQKKVEVLEAEGKQYLIHVHQLSEARRALLDTLEVFHQANPMRLGIKRPELRAKSGSNMSVVLFEVALTRELEAGSVVLEGDRIRLSTYQLKLTPHEQAEFDRLDALFAQAGLSAPSLDEALVNVERRIAERVKVALLESGRLVDCGDGVILHREVIAAAVRRIKELFVLKRELTTSEIRQELGTTRKYVIPLLNYLDSIGLTRRRGDVRVLQSSS